MQKLLYIFFILLLSGCTMSSSFSRQLDDAQSLLGTNPQEAYEQLNALDISEIDDSSDMARWAMLYSEAMVANNLKAPSDTIINIALSYYNHHNLKDQLNRAKELRTLLDTDSKAGCDNLIAALYIQKEREYSLYRERLTRERYTFAGIIILILAVSVIVWQRQRLKMQNLRAETLLAEASGLRSLLSVREADCSGLEEKVEKLFSKRFELIGKLCDTFYEAQGTKTERKAIAEQVKKEIESLKTDSGTMAEIETSVNECRNGILTKLKADMPSITEDDYQLMTLLSCGFSNRAISMLLGETIEVIYKRKSRLKSKLKSGGLENEALYLSVF